jgi:hypothetical protein
MRHDNGRPTYLVLHHAPPAYLGRPTIGLQGRPSTRQTQINKSSSELDSPLAAEWPS